MVYARKLDIAHCAIREDPVYPFWIYSLHLPTLNSQSISLPPTALGWPQAWSLCLWVYFCLVGKFICARFSIPRLSGTWLSLSDFLHLAWHSSSRGYFLLPSVCNTQPDRATHQPGSAAVYWAPTALQNKFWANSNNGQWVFLKGSILPAIEVKGQITLPWRKGH